MSSESRHHHTTISLKGPASLTGRWAGRRCTTAPRRTWTQRISSSRPPSPLLLSDSACRPCRDLHRELKFYKMLEKKAGTSKRDSLYKQLDLNTLVERTGSPVEIVIKVFLILISLCSTCKTPPEKRREREGGSLQQNGLHHG